MLVLASELEDVDEGETRRRTHANASIDVNAAVDVALALAKALGQMGEDAAPRERARAREALERALRDVSETDIGAADEESAMRAFAALVGVLALPRRGSHEGVTEETMRATRAFCVSAAPETRAALRKSETAPMLGFALSTLLDIAHEEAISGALGSKSLRSSALETLDVLIRFVDDSDALAFFLPGVVSGLTKALAAASGVRPNVGAGPGGTGADGVEFALSSMGSILSCVLDDSLYAELCESGKSAKAKSLQLALDEILSKSSRNCVDTNVKNQMSENTIEVKASPRVEIAERNFHVIRDGEWLRTTRQRVEAALLMTIPPLVDNERASTRLAAAKTAARIVQKCSEVLGDKVRRKMLECVLKAAGDDWPQVSEPTLDELRSLDDLGYVFQKDLENIITDDLLNIADELRASSSVAAGLMRRLLVALEFVGPVRVKEILLERIDSRELLCSTITECLLIETHDSKRHRTGRTVKLIDISESTVPTARALPRKPPRLQYLADSSLYESFAQVVRLFGKAAATTCEESLEAYLLPMAQFFLGTLRDNSNADLGILTTTGSWQRNAAAHVIALNEMMFGAMSDSAIDKGYLNRLAGLVVEDYACSKVWDLNADDPDNAILLRYLMEGFGIVAGGLGVEYIRKSTFLTTVLCPLLEKLGEDSIEVRDTAALVLLTVARSGEYDSVDNKHSAIGNLVVANADYVVDMISRHLRHIDEHARAPRLFAALMRRTDAVKSVIKLLGEPIHLALRTFLITNRDRNKAYAEDFLLVMKEYFSAVVLEVKEIDMCSQDVMASLQRCHPGELDSDDELAEIVVDEIRQVLTEDPETEQSNALNRVRCLQSMVSCAKEVLRCVSALLESPQAGARALAAAVCALSIESLAAAESALRNEKYILKVLKAYGGESSLPFDIADLYKEARVLPHVHNIWPHAVLSLSDRFQLSVQSEAFGASLQLFRTLACTSGGEFISKRTKSDLWPIFARILKHGVRHVDTSLRSLDLLTVADSVHVGSFSDDEISPELTNTIQIMICDTLESIASSEKSKDALKELVAAALPVVAKLAVVGGKELRSAAERTIRAFANVDGDEVWLFLIQKVTSAGICPELPTPKWGSEQTEGWRLPDLSEIVPTCRVDTARTASAETMFALKVLNSLAL